MIPNHYSIDLVDDDENSDWLPSRRKGEPTRTTTGSGDSATATNGVASASATPTNETMARSRDAGLHTVAKEWEAYGTSRNGTPKWRNTLTGEVRYQMNRPGERGEGEGGKSRRNRKVRPRPPNDEERRELYRTLSRSRKITNDEQVKRALLAGRFYHNDLDGLAADKWNIIHHYVGEDGLRVIRAAEASGVTYPSRSQHEYAQRLKAWLDRYNGMGWGRLERAGWSGEEVEDLRAFLTRDDLDRGTDANQFAFRVEAGMDQLVTIMPGATFEQLKARVDDLRHDLASNHQKEWAALSDDDEINLRSHIDAVTPPHGGVDETQARYAIAVMESALREARQNPMPRTFYDDVGHFFDVAIKAKTGQDRYGGTNLDEKQWEYAHQIRDRVMNGDSDLEKDLPDNDVARKEALQKLANVALLPALDDFHKATGIAPNFVVLDPKRTEAMGYEWWYQAKVTEEWLGKAKDWFLKMKANGYPMPDQFEIGHPNGDESAFYTWQHRDDGSAIRLAFTQHNLKNGWTMKLTNGFTTTEGIEATMAHEFGHHMHNKTNAEKFMGSLKEMKYRSGGITSFLAVPDFVTHLDENGELEYVRAQVSDYATYHPVELVAETFSKAHAGGEISQDAFNMYVHWGGHVDDKVRAAVNPTLPGLADHWRPQFMKEMGSQNLASVLFDEHAKAMRETAEQTKDEKAKKLMLDAATRYESYANRGRQFSDEKKRRIADRFGIKWDPNHIRFSDVEKYFTNWSFGADVGAAFDEEVLDMPEEREMILAEGGKLEDYGLHDEAERTLSLANARTRQARARAVLRLAVQKFGVLGKIMAMKGIDEYLSNWEDQLPRMRSGEFTYVGWDSPHRRRKMTEDTEKKIKLLQKWREEVEAMGAKE